MLKIDGLPETCIFEILRILTHGIAAARRNICESGNFALSKKYLQFLNIIHVQPTRNIEDNQIQKMC